MLSGILAALIGLVSALLGGAIQAFATGKFERTRFERKAKWDVYTAYFESLATLSFYPGGSERHVAALAAMAHIRGRIALYGSDEVIEAVAAIFQYPNLTSDDAQAAMSKALRAMRPDVGQTSSRASEAELRELMFASRDTVS